MPPGILVLTEKRLAFKLGYIARISVLAEKRIAFKLGHTARNFGPGRITPRIQIGKCCQEFRFWPKNASQEFRNWDISPGILILSGEHLAFKLGNTARNSSPDRQTPRI